MSTVKETKKPALPKDCEELKAAKKWYARLWAKYVRGLS